MKIESSYELTINGEEYMALRRVLSYLSPNQMKESGVTPAQQQLLMDMVSEMNAPDD